MSGNAVAEVCARILPSPLAQLVFIFSPVVYAFALAPVLSRSTLLFLALAGLAQLLFVWVPFLAVFDKGDLGRSRNPYVDMYDDPFSRPWITSRARPAQNAYSTSIRREFP